MKKTDIKEIVENRFRRLGATQIELCPSGVCWELNGVFFKVTTLIDFWVIERSDDYSHASNYCFEDIDPMPYDISRQEIVKHADNALLK